MKMIYGVKDKPKLSKLIVYALQQLLAVMSATIALPMIVGNGMSTSAALFGAGAGTLIYVFFTKAKSPVFLGSSFAFIGSMVAAFAGGVTVGVGYAGLVIGVIFAGLVYVLISFAVKKAGVGWISQLMPAAVIGPIVAVIGLSLAGNAISDLTKVNYIRAADTSGYTLTEYQSVGSDGKLVKNKALVDSRGVINEKLTVVTDEKNNAVMNADGTVSATQKTGSEYVAIICGLITLIGVMVCSVYGKKMLSLIPFIVGILAGYASAGIFYIIGVLTDSPSLMIVDYSALIKNFSNISVSSFFAIPDFTIIKAFGSFSKVSGTYIATIAAAYIPVAFVAFAEHIADHKNLSTVIEHDLLEDPGLSRTLLGDGVGSIFGAIFSGCPNTTYGESVGCVAITRNASVATIIATAIEAMLISFLSPFVAFLSTVPSCVIGGVSISLYGFIAVSGLKMLKEIDLDDNRNLFTVSVILVAGVGNMTLSFGSVTLTEVACALILGVFTNMILRKKQIKNDSKAKNI